MRTSGNAFTKIPASVLDLINLQILNFRSVSLKSLPKDFFTYYPKLTKVDIGFNDIDAIPSINSNKIRIKSPDNPAVRFTSWEYWRYQGRYLFSQTLSPSKYPYIAASIVFGLGFLIYNGNIVINYGEEESHKNSVKAEL